MNEPRVTKLTAMSDMTRPVSRRATIIAFVVGLGLYLASLLFQRSEIGALAATLGGRRWLVIALVAVIALLPPVASRLDRWLSWAARPSPRVRAWTALSIGAAAALYLVATAFSQDRDLFPKTHDDQSYLLQIHMLARGRLWMPAHPQADFFDTFYVLSRPRYASLYFPGAALLYVPTAWLDLPTWLLPVCVAGACVGLTYRIVAEVVDGTAALLAALTLVSLNYFRVYSVLLTGHEPMLLLGLLATWAYLRWRSSNGRIAWTVAIGVFSGWGAITRPVDALCFAVPIGIGMLLDLLPNRRQSGPESLPARPIRMSATAIGLVAGALPFLGLQLVFDRGVTGHWLQTPYTLYLDQDQPNTAFGFHPFDSEKRPQSELAQKQSYYERFLLPYTRRHQVDEVWSWWGRVYLPMAADTVLPTRVLVVWLPVGLLAVVRKRPRWVVASAIPLFFGFYFFNAFFLEHYALIIAPAVIMVLLLGLRQTADLFSDRLRPSVFGSLALGLAACAVTMLPEENGLWGDSAYRVSDETMSSPLMRYVNSLPFASDLQKPAIVLVRFRPGEPEVQEPVYNSTVAWPDDAPVVFAHDLGPRNVELYRYFAERQPTRVVYLLDRSNWTADLPRLGTVAELANRPQTLNRP